MQTGQQFVTQAPGGAQLQRGVGITGGRMIRIIVTYVLLWGGAITLMLPFVWMLSTSLKTLAEVQTWPVTWIPDKFLWQNYPEVFAQDPICSVICSTAPSSPPAASLGRSSAARWPAMALPVCAFRGVMRSFSST